MLDFNVNLGNITLNLNPLSWFKKRKKYNKDNTNILFVDDNDMPVVENLKKNGFKVKKIKDIRNIDDAEVKNAQIIFVDYEGVGMKVSPKHQGAGLIKELKTKYGNSKYIVLYTAQIEMPTETTISELYNYADSKMQKDSDVTEFTEKIRNAFQKIK